MKQKCGRIRELLGAYADNELDQARADQVVRHLETCADCRRELDHILELNRLAKSVEHPKLAEDYWDWQRTRVWRGLRERKRVPEPRYRPMFVWPKLAAAAAGFVVVLVVVLAGWRTLLQRPVTTGRAVSGPKTVSEAPIAAEPVLGRSTENGKAKKTAGGAIDRAEGLSDELAQAQTTAARDAEKTGAGFAAKGTGATGAASTSRPPGVPAARLVEPEMEVAAEQRREELTGAHSPGRQGVGVSSDKGNGRIVSGPKLVGSPPAYAAAPDTGTVLLSVRTDSTGRVVNAIVSRSSGSAKLDSLAVRQMLQSRFKAAVKNNRRVPSSFEYPFHIQKKPTRSVHREKPTVDKANPGPQQNQLKGKQSDRQSKGDSDEPKTTRPNRQSDDDSDKSNVRQPNRQPDDDSDKPEVNQRDKHSDKSDGNQSDKPKVERPDKQPSRQEDGQSDTPQDSQPRRSPKDKTKE
jgi:TonB family protein